MTEDDIIKQLIIASGQHQGQRTPAGLKAGYVDIDERSSADLLRFIKRLSPFIHFYDSNDGHTPAGDWQNFFPFSEDELNAWLAKRDGSRTPHLALLQSFLTLYQHPQQLLNQFTHKHLDFYYQDVLQLFTKPAQADRAHVVFALKKNSPPVLIDSNHRLAGGKDETGVELIYQPTQATVINPGLVSSLRSLWLDPAHHGTVRTAPIANSADGLGAELTSADGQWPGFGASYLPAAETGFAIASPVLRLAEGRRTVTLTLNIQTVAPGALNSAVLHNAFDLYLTGAKQWLGPFTVTPQYNNGKLTISTTLASDAEAIVDYDAAIHGYHYDARTPIAQLLLKESSHTGYQPFANLVIQSIKVSVNVAGIKQLQLQNDLGSLDPSKAFMPFGPQPKRGSRWLVGCSEALNKKLTQLELTLQWQDAPSNFHSHYNYSGHSVYNSTFTANINFKDGGSWDYSSPQEPSKTLFNSSDAGTKHTLLFSQSGSTTASNFTTQFYYSLNSANTSWAARNLNTLLLRRPVNRARANQPPSRNDGFITLQLNHDFLHEAYRKAYVTNVLTYTQTGSGLNLPNEPYTPVLQSVALNYQAATDTVAISSTNADDFANLDVQFYQLGYFGQRREHGYQRSQFNFLASTNVTLLAEQPNRGELIIGLEKLRAGDTVSLLLQVAEGSANPDIAPTPLTWSVLCDNYWKPLNEAQLTGDTTNQLLTSGIVNITLPSETTTTNSLLPAGPVWLKAAIGLNGAIEARPKFIDVVANAIEVVNIDNGNDPTRLSRTLAAGRITKLLTSVEAIKSVAQPYASFGGHLQEQPEPFRTRVAERLRHKDRAVTVWDYERLVLQQFAAIHKVKTINHAKPGQWLAPGHVTVITIADLNNQNAINRLQPKVDSNTLNRVHSFLTERVGRQTEVHVANPRYRQVQLAFDVKFRPGFGFNFYRQQLEETIKQRLSPWAYSSAADIEFGGVIYKSVLIDLIDELDYVDFITNVQLYSFVDATSNRMDANQVQPQAPDEILVSANNHSINQYLE
ncbi:baseplate J/gp47 family protein [Halioxenophilus sp. WMMB6]|uniref:baseplate J/gp47 family protein n=1 Tax=Halioxenophilus sp. WMMB6 TaxID=3073815 RepID=UPI00295E3F3B|nr:baseplate J/gp47 family protein [Halioxenophilus sp. WMMB6]